jgi:hypothetical protein
VTGQGVAGDASRPPPVPSGQPAWVNGAALRVTSGGLLDACEGRLPCTNVAGIGSKRLRSRVTAVAEADLEPMQTQR